MMKTINKLVFILPVMIISGMILILTSCSGDEDNDENTLPPAVHPFAGTYSFVAATFEQQITVIVNGDTNVYQPGDDAYLFVGGGLLGAAPCDNADNAALELRADHTSFYVCLGEDNEAQQGTWSANDDNTVLNLNISNPNDFLVAIIDVYLVNNQLTGIIPYLPLPYDTSIPVGDPLPGGGINFQTAKVAVEFVKVN